MNDPTISPEAQAKWDALLLQIRQLATPDANRDDTQARWDALLAERNEALLLCSAALQRAERAEKAFLLIIERGGKLKGRDMELLSQILRAQGVR